VTVYLIKEEDLEALLAALERDPVHGGSGRQLTDEERRAHADAHRFYNYEVRTWIERRVKTK
jgi:hypothetical protein